MPEEYDADTAKALFQFRGQVNLVLKVFDLHGLGIYIGEATSVIQDLAMQLHRRLHNGTYDQIQLRNWRYNPDD